MRLALLAGAEHKNEVLAKKTEGLHQLYWVESVEQLSQLKEVDAYVDFEFVKDDARTEALAKYLPKAVFVNSVTHTIESIGKPFIRFNGWPGFFERSLVEISTADPATRQLAEDIFSAMNWSFQVTEDIPGMISARIIAMIINEAYFTFQEQISTKDEIDTAMKLGTNYPYGPFEWSRKIGLRNIYELLVELSRTNNLYSIATALVQDL
jgi:3-hydroxybutyryl-CoA dehydrogenase